MVWILIAALAALVETAVMNFYMLLCGYSIYENSVLRNNSKELGSNLPEAMPGSTQLADESVLTTAKVYSRIELAMVPTDCFTALNVWIYFIQQIDFHLQIGKSNQKQSSCFDCTLS